MLALAWLPVQMTFFLRLQPAQVINSGLLECQFWEVYATFHFFARGYLPRLKTKRSFKNFLLNAYVSVYQKEIKIHGLFFQPCTRAENKSLENQASICYRYAATEIYINRSMRDVSEILFHCFSVFFFFTEQEMAFYLFILFSWSGWNFTLSKIKMYPRKVN